MVRWVLALALVCGCGRTELGDSVQILAVTTDATSPGPGEQIRATMRVSNDLDRPLFIADASLEGTPALLEVVADLSNPTELAANAETLLRFTVRLPPAFESITIDGSVIVIDRDARRSYEDAGAQSPLVVGSEPIAPVTTTDLVVTVLDDELDGSVDVASAGGAADLSFREAIEIANSRAGADMIAFDPDLFGVLTPGIISFDIAVGPITVTDAETTIDGTGRGVSVQPNLPDPNDQTPLFIRANSFTIRHVDFLDFTISVLSLDNVGNAEIADCQFLNTGGLNSNRAIIDANNVPGMRVLRSYFFGGDEGIRVNNSSNVVIEDCEFVALDSILMFAVTDSTVRNTLHSSAGRVVAIQQSQRVAVSGFQSFNSSDTCIIVGNASSDITLSNGLLDNCGNSSSEDGLRIETGAQRVTVTETLIYASDGDDLEVESGANGDIAPPVIDAVGAQVTGSGLTPGDRVEVFTGSSSGSWALRTYNGFALADANGDWALTPSAYDPAAPFTATVTDAEGNTSEPTAPFSAP